MRTTHRPRFIRWLPLFAALLATHAFDTHAQVPLPCVVTSASDDPAGVPVGGLPGTLREAVRFLNLGLCSNNKITFNIDVPSVVALSAELPPINGGWIDGYTQPGVARTTDPSQLPSILKVGIDGRGYSLTTTGCGMSFTSPGRVEGLIVRNFSAIGAGLCGQLTALGNFLQNDRVGLKLNGGSAGSTGGGDGNFIDGNNVGILFNEGVVNVYRNLVTRNVTGLQVFCGNGGVVQNNQFIENTGDAITFDSGSNINIYANNIGVDSTGTRKPNGGNGIILRTNTGCRGTGDNSQNNTIEANHIKFNGLNGVSIAGAGSFGNAIKVTNISGNLLKNIDLDHPSGPLPILPGGGRTGPNHLQNYPKINSVVDAGPDTVISFTLQSTPDRTFMVSLFANATFGPPAGDLFRGQVRVTTRPSGIVDDSIATPVGYDNFSLIAEDETTKDTSELSPMVAKALVPNVTLSASSMAFGDVPVGTTAGAKTIALTSSGPGSYVISRLSSTPVCGVGGSPICGSGEFTCSTTCTSDAIYAPGSGCTITATFTPTAVRPSTGDIYICDNTSTSPQHITLTGNGVTPPPPPAPDVTLSNNLMDFGNIELGQTGGPQSVTLTSIGNASYHVDNLFANSDCTGAICTSGGFNCSSTCAPGSDWAPGTSCSISATFSPKIAGSSTTRIHVCDNTSTSPQVLTLTGNGVAWPPPPPPPTPAVTLSSNLLDFGDVNVGSSSGTGSVKLTSTGSAPFRISTFDSAATCAGGPICTGGGFACSTTCKPGTDYVKGESCEMSATFNPKVSGPATTRIHVCDNTATSPEAITLTGRGVSPPPPPPPPPVGALEIGPVSHDFGNVRTGSRSGVTTFIIINHGSVEVRIVDLQVNGRGFVMTSTTCGSALAAVSACYASVAFAPSQPGAASGSLDVSAAAGGGTPSASQALLQGNGIVAPELVLPSDLDFGMFTVGSPSPLTQTITLTNTGGAGLTLSGITVSGPFTLRNDCPTALGPAQSCTLTLEFSASAPGEFTGSLSVVSNVEGGSRAIRLTARAQPAPIPVIRVAPVTIGFGNQLIGFMSASQRVTVKNEGGVVAVLGAPSISADFVLLGTTCGATLEPQATCDADVAMRPVGFGPRAGQLLINSNAPAGPARVQLAGTGCRPYVVGGNRGPNQLCAP